MPRADDGVVASDERPLQREKILTGPLALFLGIVALVIGGSVWSRARLPDPQQAIVLLADGDLDGAERERVLRHVLATAAASTNVTERWAALLATVVLEDRPAYDRLLAALGGIGEGLQVPPPEHRELLHLGDPMLANLLQAMVLEAAADRPGARVRWLQVVAQCKLMRRPLAAEIAAAALRRLS